MKLWARHLCGISIFLDKDAALCLSTLRLKANDKKNDESLGKRMGKWNGGYGKGLCCFYCIFFLMGDVT